jgi:hypothetical protein
MTPGDFRVELQRYADRRWPSAGIEVRVSVWRAAPACERCGTVLEREMRPDGALGAGFHRVMEIEGMPVRQPHYAAYCEALTSST